MALDPSISLEVRPPQFNIQIPQPLQQFGQVLSLQNLMQQQQLLPIELQTKQLGLQQLQTQLQEQQNIAALYRRIYGDPTAPPAQNQPVAPTAPLVPQLPLNTTSIPIPGVGSVPVPAPTPADVPIPGPGGGMLSLPTPPVLSAFANPTPAAQPVAAPAGPRFPTLAEIFQAAPITGGPVAKSIFEIQKEQYDMQDKALTVQKDQSAAASRAVNGITDDESLRRNLPDLVKFGALNGAEAGQLQSRGFADPYTQKRLNEIGVQALTRDQMVDLAIKKSTEDRARALFPAQYNEAQAKQSVAEATNAANSIGDVKNPSELPGWLAQQGPTAQVRYGQLVNSNLPFDQIKQIIQMGAGGREKVALAKATEEAKVEAEQQQYLPLAKMVIKDPSMWLKLDDDTRRKVSPIVSQMGYQGFGSPPSDEENKQIFNTARSISSLKDLQKELNSPDRTWMTGPLGSQFKDIPWFGGNAQALESQVSMVRSIVGDMIKSGPLRPADQEIYERMLPKMDDPIDVARKKLNQLLTRFQEDYGLYQNLLRGRGRIVPDMSSLISGGAGTTGGAGGSAQAAYTGPTLEKTGTPGAKVTGTITIGGGVTAPPPGKIVVQAPASLGGGKYYLDSDKWPQKQKQGFIRVD